MNASNCLRLMSRLLPTQSTKGQDVQTLEVSQTLHHPGEALGEDLHIVDADQVTESGFRPRCFEAEIEKDPNAFVRVR